MVNRGQEGGGGGGVRTDEESIKSEDSTKDLTVCSDGKRESAMDASQTDSVSSVAGSPRSAGPRSSSSPSMSVSNNNNNNNNKVNEEIRLQRQQQQQEEEEEEEEETNHGNVSQSDSLDVNERIRLIHLEFECKKEEVVVQKKERKDMNKKELAHCVFVEDDHGVETIFELPNGTSEIEKKENNYKVSHVDDIRTENHSQSPKKNTSSTHVCDEKNDIMNRNGLERELYTTASMESNVSVSGNSSSGGSNSSSSCIAAAKELILSVTKEEEEEEDHGRRSDNVSKPNHENRRHDPLDKSQITAIADNNSNNNNKKIITESSIVDESNKDDGEHIDGNNIPLDKQHKTKRVLKTPLRIATSVPSDSSIRNDAIKSPMRCESPGMRRRREELGRSHRSIRELEEQLYQTEIDYQHQRQQQQQQLQLAQNQVVNTQSQHSIDRFVEAPEIQDCGQSLSSTTSSTISSFGLLHNSSRTLLSSSNAAIDNDCSSDDKVSNVSNNRDQPRKNDVTVLRKAFSGQRDSSSIIPSEEDASNTQPVSSWGTPKAANRSSPTIERDDENGGGGGGGGGANGQAGNNGGSSGNHPAVHRHTNTSDENEMRDQRSGPLVEIINGEIVIQESSIIVGGRKTTEEVDRELEGGIIEEENTALTATYTSFTNREKVKRWTVDETKKFYLALRQCGTDFSTMENFFDGTDGGKKRSRKELKCKYNRESRKHPKLIDMAMDPKVQLPYDLSVFGELDMEAVVVGRNKTGDGVVLPKDSQTPISVTPASSVVTMVNHEEEEQGGKQEGEEENSNAQEVVVSQQTTHAMDVECMNNDNNNNDTSIEKEAIGAVVEAGDAIILDETTKEDTANKHLSSIPLLAPGAAKKKKMKPKFRAKPNAV
eukprot:CAMPEP_0176495282 /NCGR_PEP_ID=MMETSP0200_2-20121128/10564_1 /TAXON_ID=947934 /ORGANISM="Chaetoceros sp., Strain GSL56" /LENGTH=882 /DNA_ID=CAMNT_0017893131 /DNA_START=105 /DNA_END=2750 /DNA_ORIENTATION=+